jgi:pimeloyl-ACP methyl ester carboxylesterase
VDYVPIDFAGRLWTIHSITSVDINGVTVPVAAVASDYDFLAVELPPVAVAAIKARPGPARIRWIEHLGHFPPAVARAIVAEGLADPALWPATGYRTELEIKVEVEQ